MSIKTVSLMALAVLAFIAGAMAVVLDAAAPPPPRAKPLPQPITGALNIVQIDDFRVGRQKIVLCGVAFTQPASARGLAMDMARRDFQRVNVTCRPVGSGTPCDGRASATFRDAVVAQCLTEDGRDVAAELSAKKILCDFPTHSGGHYTSC